MVAPCVQAVVQPVFIGEVKCVSMLNLKQLCAFIRLRAYIVGYSFLAELQSYKKNTVTLNLRRGCMFSKNCSKSLPVGWHLSGKKTKRKLFRALSSL